MRRQQLPGKQAPRGIAQRQTGPGNKGIRYRAPVQGMFNPPEEEENNDWNFSITDAFSWGWNMIRGLLPGNGVQAEPNRQNVEDLAGLLGMAPEVLVGHLNNMDSQEALEEFKAKYTVLKDALGDEQPMTGLVPQELLQDLPEGGENEIILALFHRFNHYPFRYTGESLNGEQGFLGKEGDCSTLLYMFLLTVQAAGIGISIEDCYGRSDGHMLVPEGIIHGRNETANLQGIPFWYFNNHFWFDYNGLHLDLLFMIDHAPPAIPSMQGRTYRNVYYRVFANGCAVIDQMNCGMLPGFDLAGIGENRLGMGFGSEEEAILFIDNHS